MIPSTETDWMALALQEAQKGRYLTYTNPMVGAVLVKHGRLLAVGHHVGFGHEHAEVNAYHHVQNPEDIQDSTLYVTLEPCAHQGKTPPCCRQIAAWGVKTVYVAQVDPHEVVAGKGIAYLRAHGVTVHIGQHESEAEALNRHYNFFYRHHELPYVTLKAAMSLDGKLGQVGQRTALTDATASADVQHLRADYQAILVGSETALVDDPQLTVRWRQLDYPPVRVILDRRGRVRPTLQLATDQAAPTWLFTSDSQQTQRFAETAVKVFYRDHWTLTAILQVLGEQGVQSVLVEGGARVHGAFLATDHWQEIVTYQALKTLGGQAQASFVGAPAPTVSLALVQSQVVGNAVKIVARRKEDADV